jgi:hypothetical protein
VSAGRIVVTTGARGTSAERARADEVAARTGGRRVERRGSLDRVLRDHDADLAYVVARNGETLQSRDERLGVDVGLLHAKVASGARHPLIRALGEVQTVVDGTLGLAGDALHIRAATGARVLGAEASPWVAELVSAGLRGLAGGRWSDVAAGIAVHPGSSHALLERVGPVDAVFIAPMFTAPAAAAPGYGLFRRIADHRVVDDATWSAARAVAARVVVRVEKGERAPFPDMTPLAGKAVDYWVWRRDGGSSARQV